MNRLGVCLWLQLALAAVFATPWAVARPLSNWQYAHTPWGQGYVPQSLVPLAANTAKPLPKRRLLSILRRDGYQGVIRRDIVFFRIADQRLGGRRYHIAYLEYYWGEPHDHAVANLLFFSWSWRYLGAYWDVQPPTRIVGDTIFFDTYAHILGDSVTLTPTGPPKEVRLDREYKRFEK